MSPQQHLEHRAVLLRRHAVRDLGLVSPDSRRVLERLAEQASRVIVVARDRVAAQHRRRRRRGHVDVRAAVPAAPVLPITVSADVAIVVDPVLGAVRRGAGVVGQRARTAAVARQVERGVAQRLVELHDLGAVEALGRAAGRVGAVGEVAGGEVGGHVAGVELVLQGGLDGEAGQGDAAERAELRVDARDAADQPVRAGEVERACRVGAQHQRCHRRRRVDLGLA